MARSQADRGRARTPNNDSRPRFLCDPVSYAVLDAHLQVQIELVDLNEDRLPEVSRDILAPAYPAVDRMSAGQREEFGLHENGPWRVVLPGYVLHSLDRTTDEIRNKPYHPQPGDRAF